ncbi:MAG: hypothetical protein JST04_16695 [Bdellovibrionales bacterium]|nr:hypothetical protein [Bdellovibrionales bacterium]
MSEERDEPVAPAREAIVLDAEGNVLSEPAGAEKHRRAEFKVVNLGNVGLVPKVLFGAAFVALLLLGLTVAGIALGVLFVGFLTRTIFRTKRR